MMYYNEINTEFMTAMQPRGVYQVTTLPPY